MGVKCVVLAQERAACQELRRKRHCLFLFDTWETKDCFSLIDCKKICVRYTTYHDNGMTFQILHGGLLYA